MQEYTDQLKKRNFDNYHKKRNHNKGKKARIYCDDILTFDIETTSAWVNEYGNVIKYKRGFSNEYWNNLQPLALCYIWQFGINETVYFGRTLEDFKNVLNDLPKDMNFIIWVHNLSFEAHFLFNILTGLKMFCRTPHKPMYLISEEYPHIQFRCSYMLTRLSLDNWGKSLGVKKLTGDLEYNKIRTPLTKLTDKELDYAERDCIVVYHGIKKYLETYETQENIPLTQTGTVRRIVKEKLMKNPDYVRYIKTLVPHNAKEYKMLQHVFAGGYTHANRMYAGVVQGVKETGEIIEHFDFSSSYPTVLVAYKYPCTPWAYIPSKTIPSDFDDNAYIMTLKFYDIRCETCNSYIQIVKCAIDSKITQTDNGRLLEADEIEITITELDYEIIRECYSWDSVEVMKIYKSQKDYLPKPYIEYILELYGNKTSLKGIDDPLTKELYSKSKEAINSLYGMTVTALLQSDVTYDENTGEWGIDKLTEKQVDEHLKKLRNFNPKERRYFLAYSWGIYCTAYARYNLFKCLLSVDDRVLYADTDSLFILGNNDFTWYNNYVDELLKNACEYHNIDFELTRPKTKKGIKKPLGYFEREDNCIEFLTLGAKRYIERREDDKLYLTVSGINKEAVYCLKNDITNFHGDFEYTDKDGITHYVDGFEFDKDFPTVKKKIPRYIDDMKTIKWSDGYVSNCRFGIALRPNGYKLTMNDKYKKLIQYENVFVGDLPETFINSTRGRF